MFKMKPLAAILAASALALGGVAVAFPAIADDSTDAPSVTTPSADPTPVESTPTVDTPTDAPTTDAPTTDTAPPAEDPQPAVASRFAAVAPAASYVIVAWAMPSWIDSTTPSWSQTYVTSLTETTPDLGALDSQLTKCGSQWQVDIYNDNDTTTTLIAGAHLDGPNNPAESLISGGWGTAYKLLQGPACPPPPTNRVCSTISDGGTSTNLDANGWASIDTRSAGHAEYVAGGLHTFTDDATSNAKVSWGHTLSGPLSDLGTAALNYTATTGIAPGINVFVTFASGLNGTLVWESVYGGADWWLTTGSSAGIVAPETGGGFGSNRHGTIDEWLAAYPGATMTGFAFSLGSGVHADGILHSITVDCTVYSFDHITPLIPVEVAPATSTDPTCDTGATYTLPEQPTGIKYALDAVTGIRPVAGTFTLADGDTVTVVAHSIAGYVPVNASWTFTGASAIAAQSTDASAPCYVPPVIPTQLPTPTALAQTGSDTLLTVGLPAGGVTVLGILLATIIGLIRARQKREDLMLARAGYEPERLGHGARRNVLRRLRSTK